MMAGVAVPTYRESFLPVMAGTARFSLFHFSHSHNLVARRWLVYLRVAIAALKGFQMDIMAELDVAEIFYFEDDIASRMTLAALVDAEGSLSIVAGAAGFPFIHFRHRYPLVVGSRVIQFFVAGIALHIFQVLVMAENNRSCFADLEGNVLYLVTRGALAEGKGGFAVAHATGFPFFHIGHRVAGVQLHVIVVA